MFFISYLRTFCGYLRRCFSGGRICWLVMHDCRGDECVIYIPVHKIKTPVLCLWSRNILCNELELNRIKHTDKPREKKSQL